MESFRAGNYLSDESDLQAAMLVFALLGWKWRLEVKAQQWFWPWGQMESFRAGNYLSVESDLQAAMLVFVLLEWKWRLSSGSGHGDGWKAFAPVIIYRTKAICRLRCWCLLCWSGSGGSAVVLAVGTDGKLSCR
jgi:hypothetical protein